MYETKNDDGILKSSHLLKQPKPFGKNVRSDMQRIGYIYEQLKPFVLSYEQWEKNQYPPIVTASEPTMNQPPPSESSLSALVNDKIRDDWYTCYLRGHMPKDFQMMELKEAQQFIQPYIIRHPETDNYTKDGIITKENDTSLPVHTNQTLLSLLPFVSHHHPGLMKKIDSNNTTVPSSPNSDTTSSTTPLLPALPPYYDKDYVPFPNTRRIFAIDCKMVETELGKELARVTLYEMVFFDPVTKTETIDIYKSELLDHIVQPYNRITNYLTKYSGISASTYENADNRRFVSDGKKNYHHNRRDVILRLEQVQAILLQVLHPNDIVIGHSLENDLHALRFIHPTVVDTAIMFQDVHHTDHDNGNDSADTPLSPSSSIPTIPTTTRSFKHSLRHLAAVLLEKEIQRPDQPHCSQENAKMAMELAVHRAIRGPSFCMYNTKGNRTNWFTKLSQPSPKHPITAVAVGPNDWLRQHVLSPSSSSSPFTPYHVNRSMTTIVRPLFVGLLDPHVVPVWCGPK
jgi:DNA polymerase III epsilon subunit-like protein